MNQEEKELKYPLATGMDLDEDKLEQLTYQMITAYQALKEEQQKSAEVVQQLQSCVGQITSAIQEAALKSTKEMVSQFMDKIILALKEQLWEWMEKLLTRLEKIVKRGEDVIEKQNQEISKLWVWMFIVAVVSCVIGGMLGGLTVRHYIPDVTVSAELQQHLNNAALIETAWPKLSKTEQTKIIALAKGDNRPGVATKSTKK